MAKALSTNMQLALECARAGGGSLHRWPGGYWYNHKPPLHAMATSYGTTTVHALVERGAMIYTKMQAGRSGPFPIEASIPTRKEKPDACKR
jgi:hypothetical protein